MYYFIGLAREVRKTLGNPISVLPRFLLSGPSQIALSFSWSKKPEDMIVCHNDIKNTLEKMFHRKSEIWTRSYRCTSYICELSQKRNFYFIAYVSGTWARGRERSRDVLLGKWRCGSSLEILDITSIGELVEKWPFLVFGLFPKDEHEMTRFAVLITFWRLWHYWQSSSFMIFSCAYLCSGHVQLFCNPMDCSSPGFSCLGFSRQEYWHGLTFLPPGDLRAQGSNPYLLCLLHWQVGFLHWATREAQDSFLQIP